MSEDTLLKALASRAREQQPNDWVDDALWDRYAAGNLSDEELQELLSRTPSEDADKMEAAFSPLDQDFKNKLVDAASEQFSLNASKTPLESNTASDKVVSLESRRNKLFAPLALAATLLLAIGTWQFGLGSPGTPAFPAYELSVLGGSAYRSPEVQQILPEFAAGDRLEIRLTPATAVDSPLQGKVYAQTTEGLMPLDEMTVELAATGAGRIAGRVGDTVVLNSGVNTLVVVIGQSDQSPEAADLYRRFDQSGEQTIELHGDGWHAWRIRLVVDALP